jgi:hypothetical protein
MMAMMTVVAPFFQSMFRLFYCALCVAICFCFFFPWPLTPKLCRARRHYHETTLLKGFDFTFGFCIPNSTNSWEAIYTMPQLEAGLVDQIIANPWVCPFFFFFLVIFISIFHFFMVDLELYSPPAPSAWLCEIWFFFREI